MGVDVNVHTGVVAKINLKPTSYDVTINSCPNTGCENYAHNLLVKFCSACGSNTEEITVKKYGVINWEDFMATRDWEGEDVLTQSCDSHNDVDGFQILISYEWEDKGRINLSPDQAGIATIKELEADAVISLAKFNADNAELIKAAEEFFGDRFSYDYSVCSYWA